MAEMETDELRTESRKKKQHIHAIGSGSINFAAWSE
jgi:hypothetical protein